MNINKITICHKAGFSLTEMLIATGIMAVGLVLVALIFPVGVKLTTMTTERTIAAVAADEAFAKIRLEGLRDFQYWPPMDPNTACSDFMFTADVDSDIDGDVDLLDSLDVDWPEFLYPSDLTETDYKYCWSALCRRAAGDEKNVQVTVFVNRTTFGGVNYYGLNFDGSYSSVNTNERPSPVRINVDIDTGNAKILIPTDGIFTAAQAQAFLDAGYTIVDDFYGTIYQIDEIKDGNIILRQNWVPDIDSPEDGLIWLVPPGVGSSRYPCVGVFQKVIRFDEIE